MLKINNQTPSETHVNNHKIKQINVNNNVIFKVIETVTLTILKYSGGSALATWTLNAGTNITISGDTISAPGGYSCISGTRTDYTFNSWNTSSFTLNSNTTIYGIWDYTPALHGSVIYDFVISRTSGNPGETGGARLELTGKTLTGEAVSASYAIGDYWNETFDIDNPATFDISVTIIDSNGDSHAGSIYAQFYINDETITDSRTISF